MAVQQQGSPKPAEEFLQALLLKVSEATVLSGVGSLRPGTGVECSCLRRHRKRMKVAGKSGSKKLGDEDGVSHSSTEGEL